MKREEGSKLQFSKITHDDMDVIWNYLQKEHGKTTDFSYGGVLMWVDLFKYEFAILDNTLFIKGVVENDLSKPAFSLPVGDLPLSESIAILKEYCKSKSIILELSAVPEYAIEHLKALGAVKVEPLEDWSDYIYDASMLASLSGKKMSKKRNHVNNFESHYPDWVYEDLKEENLQDAYLFMDKYDEEADDNFMAHEESALSRKVLKLMQKGDAVLKGGILYSSPGEVCAITIGDIKDDTLFVHIEKGEKHINGSYEKINKEFASRMLKLYPEIKFINREDDSGDPGLRHAKESYHPLGLLRKYNVIMG